MPKYAYDDTTTKVALAVADMNEAMQKAKALFRGDDFTSKSDDWQTPADVYRDIFEKLDVDVTDLDDAAVVAIGKRYTKGMANDAGLRIAAQQGPSPFLADQLKARNA